MCSKIALMRELGIYGSSDSSDSEGEIKMKTKPNLPTDPNFNELVEKACDSNDCGSDDKMKIEPNSPINSDFNDFNVNTCVVSQPVIEQKPKKNYNIWSDILLERQLVESLSKSVKLNDNHGYNFKRRATKRLKADKCETDNDHKEERTVTVKVFNPRADKQVNNNVNQNNNNNKKKKKNNKNIGLDPIVHVITTQLKEPKVHLIRKVVDVIGCHEAMRLCTETLDVESAGGIMTTDGNRRRTPGGVFFTLLRCSKKISTEQKEQIFNSERQMQQKRKKVKQRIKRAAINSAYRKVEQLNAN